MKIISTNLPGVIVFEPKKFGDKRGFFIETFRADVLHDAGINEQFVQDNHSRSSKGVLRTYSHLFDVGIVICIFASESNIWFAEYGFKSGSYAWLDLVYLHRKFWIISYCAFLGVYYRYHAS